MKRACLSILLSVSAGAGTAFAQTGQVYSLTDQQKAQVRDATSAASADAMPRRLPEGGPDRQVHGEIAATIGTGGARSLGGTAAITLGQNGAAVVTVESSRFRDRPYRLR